MPIAPVRGIVPGLLGVIMDIPGYLVVADVVFDMSLTVDELRKIGIVIGLLGGLVLLVKVYAKLWRYIYENQ